MDQLTSMFFVGGGLEHRNIENPSSSVDAFDDLQPNGANKIHVNGRTAKTFAPWWQALNVLSGDTAQLPLVVYRRLDPTGKTRDTKHPAYKLLHRRPNNEMGPFQFKQHMMMQCLSSGNAYAFIERTGGRPVGLRPLEIDSVTPVRQGGVLYYIYSPGTSGQQRLDASEVLHLRGPSDDGLEGKSVVRLAADSLSVGLQARRYGAKFFENDAKPGVVLEFPDAIDGPTAKNVLKYWSRTHGGPNNAGRPGLLDRGGKANAFSMSNVDATLIETLEFSRTEVANWLNLPPHKVGDFTHATFSNIEQMSLDYVIYSLMPWLIRFQDECNEKLFTEEEKRNDSHFCEFIPDALLRGDYVSRMDGHVKSINNGIRNLDEVRSIENLNPLPDGKGQTHYVPMNVSGVGQKLESPAGNDRVNQIADVTIRNCVARAYQRLGKSATRAAFTAGKLQTWRDVNLVAECKKLRDELSPICDLADDCSATAITDRVASVFRNLINSELDVDDDTLKARFEARAKDAAKSYLINDNKQEK